MDTLIVLDEVRLLGDDLEAYVQVVILAGDAQAKLGSMGVVLVL